MTKTVSSDFFVKLRVEESQAPEYVQFEVDNEGKWKYETGLYSHDGKVDEQKEGDLETNEFHGLVSLVEGSEFNSFENSYSNPDIHDGSTTIVEIKYKGEEKVVRLENAKGPENLHKIVKYIIALEKKYR